MKISQLITILTKTQKQFGDVPVRLLDEDWENSFPVDRVLKMCLPVRRYDPANPDKGVDAIALVNEENRSTHYFFICGDVKINE